MKHLIIFISLVTLAGCSLTTKPNKPINNSGITVTGQISTGINLMSGEDLTLSGSMVQASGSHSRDLQDGIAFIQDYNVWVKSGSTLTHLTKNGGRTDLCNNGQPLEYLDPRLLLSYLFIIVRCKDESSDLYVIDLQNNIEYKYKADFYGLLEYDLYNTKFRPEYGEWIKLIDLAQSITNLQKRGKIIFNRGGDIEFQLTDSIAQAIGNGPLFSKTVEGMLFMPDYIPNHIQKLSINKNLNLYFDSTSFECRLESDIQDECYIHYKTNISYIGENGGLYSKIEYGSMSLNEKIYKGFGEYTNYNYIHKISLPSKSQTSNQIINNYIFYNEKTKKAFTDTEIEVKIQKLEKERGSSDIYVCYTNFFEDYDNTKQYFIKSLKGKHNCERSKTESIVYERNPETDALTFIKAEPVTNQ